MPISNHFFDVGVWVARAWVGVRRDKLQTLNMQGVLRIVKDKSSNVHHHVVDLVLYN